MKLVIVGPPGSGKGTQSERLCERYGIPQISTGDLLRHEMQNRTDLGLKIRDIMQSGNLVHDDFVLEVLLNRLKKDDCKKGFVLDGFPRTVSQAKLLVTLEVNIDKAIYISCSDEFLLKRMTSRRICANCDRIYNIITSPPKQENVCDSCGCELIQRPDDNESIVAERIAVYHEMTEPVINYFEMEGVLKRIDGNGNIDDTSKAIFAALEEK